MERPKTLKAEFVDKVDEPGRYSDGPGRNGLSLLVRMRATGLSKSWQQQWRVQGRLRSFGLGTYPTIKLASARRQAADNVAQLRVAFPSKRLTGVDRLIAESAEGGAPAVNPLAPTFAETAQQALEYGEKKWRGSRTAIQRQRLLDTYVNPVMGDIPIDQVTSDTVMESLTPIWHDKAPTARKVWQAVRATFNYAIGRRFVIDDPLPNAKIGLGEQSAVTRHHEAIPHKRMGEVWRYLREQKPSNIVSVLEFIVLTGVRREEARMARWVEIDMAEAVWTIPALRMKGGREHRVPLSNAALDVLRRARQLAQDGAPARWDYVFLNGGGRPVGKESALKLLKRQFPGVTVHGFRSSFDNWASEKGFRPEIINHALAHLEGSATVRSYRHTTYFDARREMMDAWAGFVTKD